MLKNDFHVGSLERHVQWLVRLAASAVGVVQPAWDDFRCRDVVDVGAETVCEVKKKSVRVKKRSRKSTMG